MEQEVQEFLSFQERIVNWAIAHAPKLLASIVVVIIGFWVVTLIGRMINRFMRKSKVDASLYSFISSISEITMKIVVVITAATILGIPVTTFIAILSAAGLAIGLALKDSLANFAGGILILAFGIFKLEDFIEIDGYTGTVKEIKLLYTRLNTIDNRRIIIPNGDLANGKITNFTAEQHRRVDMIFKIGHKDDLDKAKMILRKLVALHPLIIKEPEPVIVVAEITDYSINIAVRVWCNKDDYWEIHADFQEEVKKEFDREHISLPSPKNDIHVYNEKLKVKES